MRFCIHPHTHTTLSRTPLDEGLACHRDLYLPTHNTHNRQTSMLLAVFKPAIPASEHIDIWMDEKLHWWSSSDNLIILTY